MGMRIRIILSLLIFFAYIGIADNNVYVYNVPKVDNTIEYSVTATMYYPVKGQCDKDPLVTAGMYKINEHKASKHKWIAVSRDLLKRWGGKLNYGDMVKVEGTKDKDGVYKVVDTMNKRFRNRMDFLETKGTSKYKYDNVKITRV